MSDKPNDEFMECEACAAKPGAPTLCAACIHNRDLIARLLQQRRRVQELFGLIEPDRPEFHNLMGAMRDYLPLRAIRTGPGEYDVIARNGQRLWFMEGTALATWVCASINSCAASCSART